MTASNPDYRRLPGVPAFEISDLCLLFTSLPDASAFRSCYCSCIHCFRLRASWLPCAPPQPFPNHSSVIFGASSFLSLGRFKGTPPQISRTKQLVADVNHISPYVIMLVSGSRSRFRLRHRSTALRIGSKQSHIPISSLFHRRESQQPPGRSAASTGPRNV